MAEYFTQIATSLGVPIWMFITILVWSLAWKLTALWKSARKGSVAWFVILALLNTVGILPILYIFVFSKMKCCELKTKKKVGKPKSGKKKK